MISKRGKELIDYSFSDLIDMIEDLENEVIDLKEEIDQLKE